VVIPIVDALGDQSDGVTSRYGAEPTFFFFDEHDEFGDYDAVFERFVLYDVDDGLLV
jgi:hypothetical protein